MSKGGPHTAIPSITVETLQYTGIQPLWAQPIARLAQRMLQGHTQENKLVSTLQTIVDRLARFLSIHGMEQTPEEQDSVVGLQLAITNTRDGTLRQDWWKSPYRLRHHDRLVTRGVLKIPTQPEQAYHTTSWPQVGPRYPHWCADPRPQVLKANSPFAAMVRLLDAANMPHDTQESTGRALAQWASEPWDLLCRNLQQQDGHEPAWLPSSTAHGHVGTTA